MSSAEPPVLVEVRDRRMHLTLNRPHVLNAHDQPLRQALVDAIDRFEADDELRVAILSGAGRGFSSGADINELHQPGFDRGRTTIHFDRIWRCDKPIIAVCHGPTVGGGFELAQLCDIRVAAADARFGQPEPRNTGGIGGIALHHLQRHVGRGEAMLVHLTGRPITAQRAYDIGLVQRLEPDRDAALAAADELAGEMIECSPSALARAKQLLRASADLVIAQEEVLKRQLPEHRREDGAARRSAFLARGEQPGA